MSDLQLGQTAWNRLMREAGFYFGVWKYLRDAQRKFALNRLRTQVVEENDVNGFTSAWTLAGAVFGTNTDEDGRLYVRIEDETPGAGQAQVSVYRAAGGAGGDLVARGSGANSTTVTLTAQNSSGLTGTVAIGVVSASEINDQHRLLVFPDFAIRARTLFDNTQAGHGASHDAWLDASEQVFASLAAAMDQIEAAFVVWVNQRAGATLRASAQDSALINRTARDVGEGVVETSFTGLLELWRDDMDDETDPAEQTVVQNIITPGAGVDDAQNAGEGTIAAPTMYPWARDGLITMVCTDATVGAEQFALSQRDDVTNEVLVAENKLTVARPFSDPTLGIQTMTLTRTMALTGAANDFGVVADWSIGVGTESEENTDSGVIYLRVEVNPDNAAQWRINGYSDSGRTVQTFTTAFVAASTSTAIVDLGGGLTGTARVGAAPTNNNTGSLDLQTFETQNANGVPDKFTVDVVVTSTGQFQKILGEELLYRFNSAALGAETIDDSYVSAGTFPPYQVEDA